MLPTLSLQQVEQKENSNWVILNRKVYNIGDFYSESRDFPQDVKIVEGALLVVLGSLRYTCTWHCKITTNNRYFADYLASTKNRSSYPDPPQVLQPYLVGVLEDAPAPRPCVVDEDQQIVAHCLDIERSLGLLLVKLLFRYFT